MKYLGVQVDSKLTGQKIASLLSARAQNLWTIYIDQCLVTVLQLSVLHTKPSFVQLLSML